MKQVLFSLFAVCAMQFANAQDWSVDNAHSSIKFSITHMMVSDVEGNFKNFVGKVVSDKPDFTDAKIDFSIDATSINTNDEKRDGHLKSPDFFDTQKFALIMFKGTSMKKIGEMKYELEGELTLHGVTKKVKWNVNYRGSVKDPYGMNRAGFKCETTINRKDYGITYNKTLDNGGVVLSEEVAITANIEITKK